MVEREYASVTQMKGSMSMLNAPDPAAFERANYIKTLVELHRDRGHHLRNRVTSQRRRSHRWLVLLEEGMAESDRNGRKRPDELGTKVELVGGNRHAASAMARLKIEGCVHELHREQNLRRDR